jgi:PadR family transcriptional regulator, regulatory protein PadR
MMNSSTTTPSTAKRSNPEYLNGVPELLVLQVLSRRPMHGYEVVQSIKAASSEVLEFGEGSIYPLLHRLEADECLASKKERVAGRDRYVYRLTAKCARRLTESTAAWKRIASAIVQVLEGEGDAAPAMA